MALKVTPVCNFGEAAQPFSLPGTDGKVWSLEDCTGPKGVLVMFLSNHCPYVKAIRPKLVRDCNELSELGIHAVAVMPNDTVQYPADSMENMAVVAGEFRFPFPYLLDETQEVAHAYRAACTPDIFLYDKQQKLFYRGQLDRSRPGNDIPVTGQDIRAALDAVLAGGDPPAEQIPGAGCNIKWKPGNEPDFAR